MRQRKGKKIFIYLFLFILVSSINNISLSNIKFEDVNNIKIFGLNNNENEKLLNDIKILNLNNIFFLNRNIISKIISSNSLVENYEIFKKYPSTLDIRIQKTKFLAKIRNKGQVFLIGSNGMLSNVKYSDEELPFIFGKPKIEEFLELIEIIDQSKFTLKDIKNLYFFPSKRWDLELKNKITLKLSRDNTKLSLYNAFEVLNDKNFMDIKIVDARVKNQIILYE